MTPELLLACHVLWIHFLAQPVIDLLAANSVASLVASQWRDAANSPALFINPRIMLPRLLAATDSEHRGWRSSQQIDRKSVVAGKSVAGRVDFGGGHILKKKNIVNSSHIQSHTPHHHDNIKTSHKNRK